MDKYTFGSSFSISTLLFIGYISFFFFFQFLQIGMFMILFATQKCETFMYKSLPANHFWVSGLASEKVAHPPHAQDTFCISIQYL